MNRVRGGAVAVLLAMTSFPVLGCAVEPDSSEAVRAAPPKVQQGVYGQIEVEADLDVDACGGQCAPWSFDQGRLEIYDLGSNHDDGPVALGKVNVDGTFDVELPPGSYDICLTDLAEFIDCHELEVPELQATGVRFVVRR